MESLTHLITPDGRIDFVHLVNPDTGLDALGHVILACMAVALLNFCGKYLWIAARLTITLPMLPFIGEYYMHQQRKMRQKKHDDFYRVRSNNPEDKAVGSPPRQ